MGCPRHKFLTDVLFDIPFVCKLVLVIFQEGEGFPFLFVFEANSELQLLVIWQTFEQSEGSLCLCNVLRLAAVCCLSISNAPNFFGASSLNLLVVGEWFSFGLSHCVSYENYLCWAVLPSKNLV